MYSVALTNTASSFIVHQLHMPEPPRAIFITCISSWSYRYTEFWSRYYCKGNEYVSVSFHSFSTVYRNIFNSTVEYVNA